MKRLREFSNFLLPIRRASLLGIAVLCVCLSCRRTTTKENPGAESAARETVASDVAFPSTDTITQEWKTESFSKAAAKQLEQIFNPTDKARTALALGHFVTAEFTARASWPSRSQPDFSDGTVSVARGGPAEDAQNLPERGADGLALLLRQINEFSSSTTTNQNVRHKIKVVRVSLDQTLGTTQALLEIASRHNLGAGQLNATLDCTWELSAERPVPLLSAITISNFQSVNGKAVNGVPLQEVTAAALQDGSGYSNELSLSSDYWAQRTESGMGSDFMGYHGVSVADVNGDGLDDVYLCQPGGLPNRLYLQEPNGATRDASQTSGLNLLDSSRCALFLDLDNDGDQDTVISTASGVMVFEQNAQTKFVFRGKMKQTQRAYSLAAADYDTDGDLDVYACLYHSPPGDEVGNPVPYHDAQNGSANRFFENLGGLRFADATSRVGLDQNNNRWSYAASWEDYDNDGDPDLYVANDFGRNNLYRNSNGRFEDVAAKTGVEDIASGMSVAWGDYDQDGTMDLYVSNMYSSAGGRVAYQTQFSPEANQTQRTNLQRLARGNSLFSNSKQANFQDVTLSAGVNMARWSWSACFADLNNDSFEDLLVANGNYTGEDSTDL